MMASRSLLRAAACLALLGAGSALVAAPVRATSLRKVVIPIAVLLHWHFLLSCRTALQLVARARLLAVVARGPIPHGGSRACSLRRARPARGDLRCLRLNDPALFFRGLTTFSARARRARQDCSCRELGRTNSLSGEQPSLLAHWRVFVGDGRHHQTRTRCVGHRDVPARLRPKRWQGTRDTSHLPAPSGSGNAPAPRGLCVAASVSGDWQRSLSCRLSGAEGALVVHRAWASAAHLAEATEA